MSDQPRYWVVHYPYRTPSSAGWGTRLLRATSAEDAARRFHSQEKPESLDRERPVRVYEVAEQPREFFVRETVEVTEATR